MKHLIVLSSCVALLAACSTTGDAKPAAPASTATFTGPAVFDAIPDADKGAYMKQIVMPRMTELLQQHDANRFAEVKCKTCHGDAKAHHFQMPNPDLPPLDPTDNFAKHRAKDAAMVDFMMKVVEPEMAKLGYASPFVYESSYTRITILFPFINTQYFVCGDFLAVEISIQRRLSVQRDSIARILIMLKNQSDE